MDSPALPNRPCPDIQKLLEVFQLRAPALKQIAFIQTNNFFLKIYKLIDVFVIVSFTRKYSEKCLLAYR